MAGNRRQFLAGAALAVTATALGVTGCSSSQKSGSGAGAKKELQVTWWGNEVRNKNTTKAIAAYLQAHSDVSIGPQPSEWASYWDRLATQTAGDNAPDVIQMSTSYISEYGHRGALLDLAKYGSDTTHFSEGTVDSGKINGVLYGINAGINTPTIMANPSLFEKAKVDLPDDKTWTWDELRELAAELSSKLGKGIGGISSFAGNGDTLFSAWLRQRGKELFTSDGLGFDAADARGWLELMKSYADAKAFPSASRISENASKPLNQTDFAVGKSAMCNFWSNELEAVNQASGEEMAMLRFPSETGRAAERKAWYHPSMQWSASARSKNPEAAVAFINWMTNSTECASIERAERGIPANTEVLAAITPQLTKTQQQVSKFISDIRPEIADEPVALPPGGGTLPDVLQRYALDMFFGRKSAADAAAAFAQEVTSNLQ